MNIGDKVRFLSDVGGGIIKGFQKGNIVLVEDEDGFEIPVPQDEVVVIDTDRYNFKKKETPAPPQPVEEKKGATMMSGKDYLKSKTVKSDEDDELDENLEARIIRLEMRVKSLELRLERLEGNKKQADARIKFNKEKKKPINEIIEVDLHAHEILDTTAGMSPADIKEYQMKVFRDTMNEHLKEKGRRIVFIHGKGEGVLRKAIETELKYSYKSCTYQDASFQQYGFGATMVIIH